MLATLPCHSLYPELTQSPTHYPLLSIRGGKEGSWATQPGGSKNQSCHPPPFSVLYETLLRDMKGVLNSWPSSLPRKYPTDSISCLVVSQQCLVELMLAFRQQGSKTTINQLINHLETGLLVSYVILKFTMKSRVTLSF